MLKIYFRIVYSSKESQLQLLGLEIIKKVGSFIGCYFLKSTSTYVDCDYLHLASQKGTVKHLNQVAMKIYFREKCLIYISRVLSHFGFKS